LFAGVRNPAINFGLAFGPTRVTSVPPTENKVAARLLINALDDCERFSAEWHEVRTMVFGSLRRQLNLPFVEVDFRPPQITDFLPPLAGEEQQTNDAPVFVVLACAPNLNELDLCEDMGAGFALAPGGNMRGWIVLGGAVFDRPTKKRTERH